MMTTNKEKLDKILDLIHHEGQSRPVSCLERIFRILLEDETTDTDLVPGSFWKTGLGTIYVLEVKDCKYRLRQQQATHDVYYGGTIDGWLDAYDMRRVLAAYLVSCEEEKTTTTALPGSLWESNNLRNIYVLETSSSVSPVQFRLRRQGSQGDFYGFTQYGWMHSRDMGVILATYFTPYVEKPPPPINLVAGSLWKYKENGSVYCLQPISYGSAGMRYRLYLIARPIFFYGQDANGDIYTENEMQDVLKKHFVVVEPAIPAVKFELGAIYKYKYGGYGMSPYWLLTRSGDAFQLYSLSSGTQWLVYPEKADGNVLQDMLNKYFEYVGKYNG